MADVGEDLGICLQVGGGLDIGQRSLKGVLAPQMGQSIGDGLKPVESGIQSSN